MGFRHSQNHVHASLRAAGKSYPISLILLVGAGRFERPTPCAQGRCATRLRYAPTGAALLILNHSSTRRTHTTRKTAPGRAKLKRWNIFCPINRIYFSLRGLHVKQTPRLNVLVC